MPNHHASLCQCSLFLLHFECTTFPALRQHYHGLTSRTTSVLASDPHFSMRSEGKRLQHAALALSFPHTLPFCPSALQHWQDLVALGSFCANNILDQSSLVIGQRGFKQREKKKLLSQAEISRAARFNRFSEGVTFAVVSRAFGGGGWLRSHSAPDYWVHLAKSLGRLFSCSRFPKMRCNCILGLLYSRDMDPKIHLHSRV